LFEAANIRPACVNSGLRSDNISASLVGFLLRNGVLRQQCLPAIAGHSARSAFACMRSSSAASMVQLLVYLGVSISAGGLFAYMRSDVEVPLLQIAIGAR